MMLCRACGSEMVAAEHCPTCNEAILWKCSSCEKENDRSVHTYHPQTQEPSKTTLALVGAALAGIFVGFLAITPAG